MLLQPDARGTITAHVSDLDDPVIIVGGGLAGLTCARVLEDLGIASLILEAADDVGGRVRTDKVDGFLLDRGFQIYLDSYPVAARHLDHAALDLKPFEPGALVRLSGSPDLELLIDPLRRPAKLLRTATSRAASFGDKWRVATLRARVTTGDGDALFEAEDEPTIAAIEAMGFGPTIIESFFRPFFGGVLLDVELEVSSRLFLWLFRKFSRGRACLPAAGMGAIPQQLAAKLSRSEIRLNTPVEHINGREVIASDGQIFTGRAVVIATDPPAAATLLGRDRPEDFNDRPMLGSTTLYFAADKAPVEENLLVLNGSRDTGPINSIAVLTNAAPSYAPAGQSLVSVSVIGAADPDDTRLTQNVMEHACRLLGSELPRAWRHVRTYRIANALPYQKAGDLPPAHRSVKISQRLFICGDHRDTASINGAISSGERAAEAVAEALA